MRNLVDRLTLLALLEVPDSYVYAPSVTDGAIAGVRGGLVGMPADVVGKLGDVENFPRHESFRIGFVAGHAVGTRYRGLFPQDLVLAHLEATSEKLVPGSMMSAEALGVKEEVAKPVTFTNGLRDSEAFKVKGDNSPDEWRILRAIECLRAAYVSTDEVEREENLVLAYVLVKVVTVKARGGDR